MHHCPTKTCPLDIVCLQHRTPRRAFPPTLRLRIRILVLVFLFTLISQAVQSNKLFSQKHLENSGPHIVDEIRVSDFLQPDSRTVAKRDSLLEFSPNGEKLAIRNGDNQVIMFDLKQRTANFAKGILPGFSRFEDMTFSNDGKTLFAVANGGPLGVIAWETETLTVQWSQPSPQGSTANLDDQNHLLILGTHLTYVDAAQGTKIISEPEVLAKADQEPIVALLKNVVLGGQNMTPLVLRNDSIQSQPIIRNTPLLPMIWQTYLGSISRRSNRNTSIGIKISPDGNTIAIVDRTRIMLWQTPTNDGWMHLENSEVADLNIKELPIENDILNFEFSPNGQLLAIGTIGRNPESPGQILLLDTVSGTTMGTVATSPRSFTAISFSKDNRYLAVGSSSLADDVIRIIDINKWLLDREKSIDPDSLLANLSSNNALTAWHAVATLQNQKTTLPTSLTELLGFQQNDLNKEFQSLLSQLNSKKYLDRQAAQEKLSSFGFAYPEIVEKFSGELKRTAESKYRFGKISKNISDGYQLATTQWKTICRTLAVLEGTDTIEAYNALNAAAGHPMPPIARKARASLRIWQNRFAQRHDVEK